MTWTKETKMVRVLPKDETMAKLLKHPVNKVGFRDANTAANWPDDSFTKRRIRDGDVTLESDKKSAHKEQHKHHE